MIERLNNEPEFKSKATKMLSRDEDTLIGRAKIRLEKNREQKIIYKKLAKHLARMNRVIDLNKKETREPLEVQQEEVKLVTCLRVILDAGWSVTKENWEDMLEVSGVAAVR